MKLSVVIPSYNRKDTLLKCLNALFKQTYSKEGFEIIVIDDGSTDGTEFFIKEAIKSPPVELKYFRQENKGPAAAKNTGIRNANGKVILFIGDDIIATSTLLEEHSNWHREYPNDKAAVGGYVSWAKDTCVTPFMKWLENGGPQFTFNLIKKDTVDYRYFITANISLKRNLLLRNGIFDEDFRYACYEDIELGYRLTNMGLKLLYNKNAVGHHSHTTSLINYERRMLNAGKSLRLFLNKHPELRKRYYPTLWRRLRTYLYAPVIYANYNPITFYYRYRLNKKLMEGLREPLA